MLWRHGQTMWNVERRFQGQTDIPLDETGEAQAEYAARRLATLRPDAIFSSDLIRAASTAAPLARLTGVSVTLDKELRERFGGDWEGLNDEEISARYPAERATWNPPNGEPTAAVADRVAGAFTTHFGDHALEIDRQTVSEDFSNIPNAAGVPYTYWGLGFTDEKTYRAAEKAGRLQDLPTNHSPKFLPPLQPTLRTGTEALVAAALAWLEPR